ncbi:g9226 [Coccomyxa elongata]
MQNLASSMRACSGFNASSSTRECSISRRAGAVVPRARALATPPSQEPQARRRVSQSAVAIEREVLSCPWPRTSAQASRAVPEGRGFLSCTVMALQQLWCGDGTLPADVEALAGGFTDAENPCQLEEAAEGVARLWRYQGFRL